jgi:hypothetical protein
MHDADRGYPTFGKLLHSLPGDSTALATPTKRMVPMPNDPCRGNNDKGQLGNKLDD